MQASAHPGNGAVVVRALDVDHFAKAALPLGQVVSHIGHKVGVAAVAFFHDAVFVVAVVGGAQPQGAVFLKSFARCHQGAYGGVHAAAGVQAAFQVVVVKFQGKGLQVQVLLAAQIGHGKFAHAVQVIHVAAGGIAAVVSRHSFAGQKVGGDVGDVVAGVRGLGPQRVAGLHALGAQLGAGGQGVDLYSGVVVIKLAVDRPALRGVQVTNGVAQRGLAGVAHVQRAGGVGRDKFHQQLLAVGGLLAKLGACGQHLAHHFLLGCGLEADVDKTGACNFQSVYPLRYRALRPQGLNQLLGHLARVALQGLGQLHGGGGGKVAMGGYLGRLQSGFGARASQQGFEGGGQRVEEFGFDRKHGARFYGGTWCTAVDGVGRR